MNKVILMGRLTRDPEAFKSGDTAISKFAVAVDRRFKKDGSQEADFPNCVCFGKTADFVQKYFKKGMKICLEGRLQTGSYTNKDGIKVYTTDVVVDNVEFAESKKAESSAPSETEEFMTIPEGLEEDLPFN